MKLKVNHDEIDYTLKMDDFTGEARSIDLDIGDLFIGHTKPLKEIYFEIQDGLDGSGIVLSFWDGQLWQPIDDLEDMTLGLSRSGLMRWSEGLKQVKKDHDGSGEKYWVKLSPTSSPSIVTINGINLALSCDKDLSFVPNLTDYLPERSTSFIAFHQEARNMIVQMLRNSGKKITKFDSVSKDNLILETRQIDQFDLLNIEEFRNASKYLALHLIFDFVSKSNEDVYFQRSVRFYERFLDSYNSNFASIDTNNNGVTDLGENLSVQFIGIRRE